MKHKGQAVWLQQRGQHQSVLFLPISPRTEVVLWPIMTLMKAPLCWTCEDSAAVDLVGHISVVTVVPCIVVMEFSFGLWRKKVVWCGAILLFCFRPGSSRERRTGLSVSPEQTVLDEGLAVLLWKFAEGDWVPFRKPSGMCMRKPVWATGISSKRRSTARVQRLHHGREEPVFVIRNAMEKVCIVHSLTHFLFFWSCDSPTRSQAHWPLRAGCPKCPHKSMTLHFISMKQCCNWIAQLLSNCLFCQTINHDFKCLSENYVSMCLIMYVLCLCMIFLLKSCYTLIFPFAWIHIPEVL